MEGLFAGGVREGEEGGVEEHDDLADGVAGHGHPLEPVAAEVAEQRLVPRDDDRRAKAGQGEVLRGGEDQGSVFQVKAVDSVAEYRGRLWAFGADLERGVDEGEVRPSLLRQVMAGAGDAVGEDLDQAGARCWGRACVVEGAVVPVVGGDRGSPADGGLIEGVVVRQRQDQAVAGVGEVGDGEVDGLGAAAGEEDVGGIQLHVQVAAEEFGHRSSGAGRAAACVCGEGPVADEAVQQRGEVAREVRGGREAVAALPELDRRLGRRVGVGTQGTEGGEAVGLRGRGDGVVHGWLRCAMGRGAAGLPRCGRW